MNARVTMSKTTRLTEQERADLVALPRRRIDRRGRPRLETKLSLNPAARAEAESLSAWDLLDYLPKPEPSPDFTQQTLSRLTPRPPTKVPTGKGSPVRWALILGGWAASILLFAGLGYLGYQRFVPRQPGDRELVRDLRLIENKRFYDLVDDVEFLNYLDQPTSSARTGAAVSRTSCHATSLVVAARAEQPGDRDGGRSERLGAGPQPAFARPVERTRTITSAAARPA